MKVKSIFDRYKIQVEGDTIYDPIREKWLHLTPEEAVRQKTIRFLMKRLGVPKHKIVVERSLASFGVKGSRKRIDIGVLDDEDLIMAVVECKASLTRNDEAAFQQAQDYLLNLNTRYFFVTDGDEFSGFYYDTVQFIKLEEIPKYDRWYYYRRNDGFILRAT